MVESQAHEGQRISLPSGRERSSLMGVETLKQEKEVWVAEA
jgi:hypothetical protein